MNESEAIIRKMRSDGKEWSEVVEWITQQVGYSIDVIEWARKIYYSEYL
jgi:hypothetical protein